VFLTNRDIRWGIQCGKLIVDPPPEHFNAGYDETSIDLRLGPIKTGARVWDIEAYRSSHGHVEIELGSFEWDDVAAEYLLEVPEQNPDPAVAANQLVFRRGNQVVVRRFGFLLWTTSERVGTPKVNPKRKRPQPHPELISFVNAKSTRARIGVLVHFTAPTIHAGWVGHVTLEIANLGPFELVLREGDAIAQLTVATISSAPDLSLRKSKQQTQNQADPSGAPPKRSRKRKPRH